MSAWRKIATALLSLSFVGSIALVAIPQFAFASVAYVSSTTKVDVASGNDTYSSFAVSGTNPVIIIVAGLYDSSGSVSSVVVSGGLTAGTPYLVKQQRNT